MVPSCANVATKCATHSGNQAVGEPWLAAESLTRARGRSALR